MKIELLYLSFGPGKVPAVIPCPKCQDGILKAELIKYEETADSILFKTVARKNENITEYYRCCVCLKCPDCNETVMMLGEGSQDSEDIIKLPIRSITFDPIFFIPAIHLFPINQSCPQKVVPEILKAFSLFFHDYSSCANKVRNAIEKIMDDKRIKKIRATANGKETQLTLHARIDEFIKVNPEIGNLIMAVKWISNAGSHSGAIKKQDAIDGLELLEHVVHKLYDKKDNRMKSLANKITRKKGPLRRDY